MSGKDDTAYSQGMGGIMTNYALFEEQRERIESRQRLGDLMPMRP